MIDIIAVIMFMYVSYIFHFSRKEGMNTRQTLYLMGRIIGNINAIRKGRIAQRIINILIGRVIVRRLWRKGK